MTIEQIIERLDNATVAAACHLPDATAQELIEAKAHAIAALRRQMSAGDAMSQNRKESEVPHA